jgi:hypothetical protein
MNWIDGKFLMAATKMASVRCRQIEDADIASVVDCLSRGFPRRRRAYWVRAMARLAERPAIVDLPKYGYLLEYGQSVVGVLLMIHSRRAARAGETIRCNLSSWCVDKPFRSYAMVLHRVAVKRKEVTYLNISPAAHTKAAVEAMGFRRFCNGQIVFAPILSAPRPGVRVVRFAADSPEAALLSPDERAILVEHSALGCRALICIEDGAAHPFVLQRRAAFRRLIPCQQLIYCRSMDEFVHFAGPIGRHLAMRAWPIFVADASGPVPGLAGIYLPERGAKYFKGESPPPLGDLTYTELAILGP